MTTAGITRSSFALDLAFLTRPARITLLAIVTTPEALLGIAITDAFVDGALAVGDAGVEALAAVDDESDGSTVLDLGF